VPKYETSWKNENKYALICMYKYSCVVSNSTSIRSFLKLTRSNKVTILHLSNKYKGFDIYQFESTPEISGKASNPSKMNRDFYELAVLNSD